LLRFAFPKLSENIYREIYRNVLCKSYLQELIIVRFGGRDVIQYEGCTFCIIYISNSIISKECNIVDSNQEWYMECCIEPIAACICLKVRLHLFQLGIVMFYVRSLTANESVSVAPISYLLK